MDEREKRSEQRATVEGVDLEPAHRAAREQTTRGVEQLVERDVDPPAGEQPGEDPDEGPASSGADEPLEAGTGIAPDGAQMAPEHESVQFPSSHSVAGGASTRPSGRRKSKEISSR